MSGKIDVSLVCAKFYESQHKAINIAEEGLWNFIDSEGFDIIISNQKVTYDKPNAEVYKYAQNQFGIYAHEAVAIEDITFNQFYAVQSGIECHLFPGEYSTISHKDMIGKKFISEKLEFSEIIV